MKGSRDNNQTSRDVGDGRLEKKVQQWLLLRDQSPFWQHVYILLWVTMKKTVTTAATGCVTRQNWYLHVVLMLANKGRNRHIKKNTTHRREPIVCLPAAERCTGSAPNTKTDRLSAYDPKTLMAIITLLQAPAAPARGVCVCVCFLLYVKYHVSCVSSSIEHVVHVCPLPGRTVGGQD